MVKLGDRVKDKVTGFEGIVAGITKFLYGCSRVGVQAGIKEDGTIPKTEWFDEPQLDVLKKGVIKIEKSKTKEPGGVMASIPVRTEIPQR